MRNYCLYRISCTIQLLCFFFFAIVAIEPNHGALYGQLYPGAWAALRFVPCLCARGLIAGDWLTPTPPPCADTNGFYTCQINHNVAFTLPVLSLVVITILNDGTIITIAYDKVIPENRPQKWNMKEVLTELHAYPYTKLVSECYIAALTTVTTGRFRFPSFIIFHHTARRWHNATVPPSRHSSLYSAPRQGLRFVLAATPASPSVGRCHSCCVCHAGDRAYWDSLTAGYGGVVRSWACGMRVVASASRVVHDQPK